MLFSGEKEGRQHNINMWVASVGEKWKLDIESETYDDDSSVNSFGSLFIDTS